MLTTQHFVIENVVASYSPKNGLSKRPPQWLGVSSMDVACQACGETWRTGSGLEGYEAPVGPRAIVTCGRCGMTEEVSISDLRGESEL